DSPRPSAPWLSCGGSDLRPHVTRHTGALLRATCRRYPERTREGRGDLGSSACPRTAGGAEMAQAGESMATAGGLPPARPRRRAGLSIYSILLIMLLSVSVLSSIVVGIIGYFNGSQALRDVAYEKL